MHKEALSRIFKDRLKHSFVRTGFQAVVGMAKRKNSKGDKRLIEATKSLGKF